jgi:GNAT superfamily N-acetyltransferase
VDVHADALDVLEHLNSRIPLRPGTERIERDEFVLWIGDYQAFGLAEPIPQLTVVQRLRVPDGELPRVLEDVRALLRERGRPSATWEVGPTTAPADAGAQLVALGLVPDPDGHEVAGMALVGEAPPAPSEIEVRRVESVEQRITYRRVLAEGFGHQTASDEELRRHAEAEDDGHTVSYLAYLDGEPVAAASSLVLPAAVVLNGAATREDARGKGAFRALVSARIAEARARGVDVAIVQAGPMSLPILERNGFERVMTILVYVDGAVGI